MSIDEKAVIAFLQEHPDFFQNQPDLLTELTLPHNSGEAISLIERQVELLRERNIDMRHRLNNLLTHAKDNDKLFEKTRRLVLQLLEAVDLNDCAEKVFQSFDSDFNVQYTALIIFSDPVRAKAQRARILAPTIIPETMHRFLSSQRAVCGHLRPEELAALFPNNAPDIGSAAVVPLSRGTTFGLLCVANNDPAHYRSSMGTLFLTHMADVLSRVLPRHLPKI